MFEQTFKNIDDVLRKEAGCSNELDYTEQTSWLLFLKYLDDLEAHNSGSGLWRGRQGGENPGVEEEDQYEGRGSSSPCQRPTSAQALTPPDPTPPRPYFSSRRSTERSSSPSRETERSASGMR